MLLPVMLGHSGYSRDFEREADAQAIELLRANKLSPAVMLELFTRLAAARQQDDKGDTKAEQTGLGIALASHPADEERMRTFRQAAAH